MTVLKFLTGLDLGGVLDLVGEYANDLAPGSGPFWYGLGGAVDAWLDSL